MITAAVSRDRDGPGRAARRGATGQAGQAEDGRPGGGGAGRAGRQAKHGRRGGGRAGRGGQVEDRRAGEGGRHVLVEDVVPAIMAQESSMLAAPAISILFLLLGALGLLDEGLAVRLALWTGVAQLVGWGIEVGRRLGRSWPAALLGSVVNGVFGVVIVVLEVLLH